MLVAHIFRTPLYADCSNGGISARCDRVTIVNCDGPDIMPTEDAPAVRLDKRADVLRLVPVVWNGVEWVTAGWHMFGGTYVATSDSRFADACRRVLGARFYGAVALHDRTEPRMTARGMAELRR